MADKFYQVSRKTLNGIFDGSESSRTDGRPFVLRYLPTYSGPRMVGAKSDAALRLTVNIELVFRAVFALYCSFYFLLVLSAGAAFSHCVRSLVAVYK